MTELSKTYKPQSSQVKLLLSAPLIEFVNPLVPTPNNREVVRIVKGVPAPHVQTYLKTFLKILIK